MAYGYYSGSDGLINMFPIIKIAALIYLFGEDGFFILCILFVIVSIPILIKIIIDSGEKKESPKVEKKESPKVKKKPKVKRDDLGNIDLLSQMKSLGDFHDYR
tara:strand:- start:42 stop:350 length:309 start_codon:yes stop_codon:yes gene_type:complete